MFFSRRLVSIILPDRKRAAAAMIWRQDKVREEERDTNQTVMSLEGLHGEEAVEEEKSCRNSGSRAARKKDTKRSIRRRYRPFHPFLKGPIESGKHLPIKGFAQRLQELARFPPVLLLLLERDAVLPRGGVLEELLRNYPVVRVRFHLCYSMEKKERVSTRGRCSRKRFLLRIRQASKQAE